MQLALGRLQFSIVVAAPGAARRPGAPARDTTADALETTYRREQRLQAIESERVQRSWPAGTAGIGRTPGSRPMTHAGRRGPQQGW